VRFHEAFSTTPQLPSPTFPTIIIINMSNGCKNIPTGRNKHQKVMQNPPRNHRNQQNN